MKVYFQENQEIKSLIQLANTLCMYGHLHGHLRHDSGKLSLINYYVFYSLSLSYHYIISLSLSYYIHLILYYILLYISSTFSVGTKIVVREVCYVVCHHVFRHHVFPPPRIPSPRISPTTYSVTTYFPHHVFRHHVSRSSPCDHDDD